MAARHGYAAHGVEVNTYIHMIHVYLYKHMSAFFFKLLLLCAVFHGLTYSILFCLLFFCRQSPCS